MSRSTHGGFGVVRDSSFFAKAWRRSQVFNDPLPLAFESLMLTALNSAGIVPLGTSCSMHLQCTRKAGILRFPGIIMRSPELPLTFLALIARDLSDIISLTLAYRSRLLSAGAEIDLSLSMRANRVILSKQTLTCWVTP